ENERRESNPWLDISRLIDGKHLVGAPIATARHRRSRQADTPQPRRERAMSGGGGGSVTTWIGDLKNGGGAAAQPPWADYSEQLVNLARKQLGDAPHGESDEEDAALSAFDSFCRGVKNGRFPQLKDRNDLWRILVVLTQRKVADQVRHGLARRRGGGKVRG